MDQTETTKLQVSSILSDCGDDILSPSALAFVEKIAMRFSARRDALLQDRLAVAEKNDSGVLPDFLPESKEIRLSDWRVAEAPADLQDRRVEITAPAERKKAILALNSSAKVYMADFEDSMSPTAQNLIGGQKALFDAARGDCALTQGGKHYTLNPRHECVLFVRPRGWHLPEKHVLLNGVPIAGAFFDFGLFFFHNAKILTGRGRAPYFYLPKTEHWREAELWNDVMAFAEETLGLPKNGAKATLLIETLPAVFQMHEILYAMRERLVGLNCGRWDYIFSYIKTLRAHADRVLPERRLVGMEQPFLNAYSLELIETCHRRGAHAMGGMSAFLPIRHDTAANAAALNKVREDKKREVKHGHDGTWVAHPELIPVAAEIFNAEMPAANQKNKRLNITHGTVQLLALPAGDVSAAGFDNNVQTALIYIANWLDGKGVVPIFNIMEDAATAEIARSQLWQWRRYSTRLSDGGKADVGFFRKKLQAATVNVADKLKGDRPAGKLQVAAGLLEDLVCNDTLGGFLTLPAYAYL